MKGREMVIDSDEFISIAVHDDRVVMVKVTINKLFEPAEQRNTIHHFPIHLQMNKMWLNHQDN